MPNAVEKRPKNRRMTTVVVDASAVLALINRESGWQRAEVEISAGAISAVNLSEVVTKLLLILSLFGLIADGLASSRSDPPLLIDTAPAPTTASH